jgi:hypothetical protein
MKWVLSLLLLGFADLQDPAGTYPETTAVTETRERLYVQSLHAKVIGWLQRLSDRCAAPVQSMNRKLGIKECHFEASRR